MMASAKIVGPRKVSVIYIGIQGPGGAGGGSVTRAQIVAQDSFAAAQPVYVGQSDGKARLASAAAFTSAPCVGLAYAATASGFVVSVESSVLTLADWTTVAGTASLVKGATYFLSATAGQITTTPPSALGNCIVMMGVASAVDTLSLNISQPYLR